MLYFAYGSNMLIDQIEERCPSATLLCVASLENYRLAFTRTAMGVWRGYGVADVVPAADERVWGGVIQIEDADVSALDKAEGYAPGRAHNAYERVGVTVWKDGNAVEALMAQTYTVRQREEPNPLPHRSYVTRIIAGARAIAVPAEYLSRLELIPVCD